MKNNLSTIIKKSKKIILDSNEMKKISFMVVKNNYIYFWGINKYDEIIIIEVNKRFYETEHHYLELEGHFWEEF